MVTVGRVAIVAAVVGFNFNFDDGVLCFAQFLVVGGKIMR